MKRKIFTFLIIAFGVYISALILNNISRGLIHYSPPIEIELTDYYTGNPISNATVQCYKFDKFDFAPCFNQSQTSRFLYITDETGKVTIPSKIFINWIFGLHFDGQTVKIVHPLYIQTPEIGEGYVGKDKTGWRYRGEEYTLNTDILDSKAVNYEKTDGSVKINLKMISIKDIFKQKPWYFCSFSQYRNGEWNNQQINIQSELFPSQRFCFFRIFYKDYDKILSEEDFDRGLGEIEENIKKYDMDKLWNQYNAELKFLQDQYKKKYGWRQNSESLSKNSITLDEFKQKFSQEALLKHIKDSGALYKRMRNNENCKCWDCTNYK